MMDMNSNRQIILHQVYVSFLKNEIWHPPSFSCCITSRINWDVNVFRLLKKQLMHSKRTVWRYFNWCEISVFGKLVRADSKVLIIITIFRCNNFCSLLPSYKRQPLYKQQLLNHEWNMYSKKRICRFLHIALEILHVFLKVVAISAIFGLVEDVSCTIHFYITKEKKRLWFFLSH